MKYQICYVSPQGHAEKLALGFRPLFPAGTDVVDLGKGKYSDADCYLIGFEILERDISRILDKIVEILPDVENREVLLFATYPVGIDVNFHRTLEKSIKASLLHTCKFQGLFVCRGEAYKTVIRAFVDLPRWAPKDESTAAVQEQYQQSKGHPNRNDIRNGRRFIADAWDLKWIK